MGAARYLVGDVFEQLATLEPDSVDLVMSSPPFLALRSYLPADHPDKASEIGSEPTPGAYLDVLLDVVEALDRVLAPHGSLVLELGDTFAGAGGAGAPTGNDGFIKGGWNAAKQAGDTVTSFSESRPGTRSRLAAGDGWPLDKSLCLIPQSFAWALAYGRNPFTGRETPRWRVRNVVAWCRPNPPVGALGDKFRPGTSYLTVACKGRDRYFDLDAVREPGASYDRAQGPNGRGAKSEAVAERGETHALTTPHDLVTNPAGAPPLDYWVIPTEPYAGSHYATFPRQLVVRPVKAMSPERVCMVCGRPSRRITSDSSAFEFQPRLAAHIKERREALGITSAEVNGWFGYKEIAKNWERTDQWGARIPNQREWPVLKDRLGLSDEFDPLVMGDRRWTESTIDYVTEDNRTLGADERRTVYDRGGVPQEGVRVHARREAPDRWSDCGHDAWRRGCVLDPFAGSGTTLAVAVGHGRDAIGVDLDARNAELALERVGPLFLTVEESARPESA